MEILTVIERENQRVMTTAVLAEEYGTTAKRISENFNTNKDRYTEGKHFYCLEGELLKEFRANTEITDLPSNINKLYLWTEKGAFLHAKSLGTDRAWEVYDILIESYFAKQAPKSQAEILLGQAQMLVNVERKQREQDTRVTVLEDNQKAIHQAVTKPIDSDFKAWVKKCLDAIAQSPKYVFVGDNAFQAARRESYDRLNNKRPSMLDQRVKNAKRRARENGASETAVERINKLTVILDDKDLKPVYEAVIREMMIVYCVKVA